MIGEIEASAKRRLADEYDAAQVRGDVVGKLRSQAELTKPTASDIGLSRKDIHEARIIRDAEVSDPSVVPAEDKIAKKRRDSTARQQRSRDRRRRGVCLMSLEVNQGQIADDLVAAGVLKEWDSEDPDRIRDALKEAMNMLRVARDG